MDQWLLLENRAAASSAEKEEIRMGPVIAAPAARFFSELRAGEYRLHIPRDHAIERCLVVRIEITHSIRRKLLVLPVHQSVRLADMVGLFVSTMAVIPIAVVAIADHQRLQIVRQISAE